MKILILEDSGTRIKLFEKHLGKDHELFFFDRVDEAEAALELIGDFDILFLDHDLDNRVFVDSKELNTGYQFAKWISKQNMKFEEIIIHSMNPVGAQNIKAILPEAKIIPFTNLF